MGIKKTFLIIIILSCNLAFALENNYFQGTIDNFWNTTGNWSNGKVSDLETFAWMGWSPGPVIIDSNTTANAYQLFLAHDGAPAEAAEPNVVINGGTINTVHQVYHGIYMTEGTGQKAILTLNGGTINCGEHYYLGYGFGSKPCFRGTAILNVNGGNINVSTSLQYPNCWFYVAADFRNTHIHDFNAIVNLAGGTITTPNLQINSGGIINISGNGKLAIRGDYRTVVTQYVTSEWIKAYNGNGIVNVVYDPNANQTMVTASQRSTPCIAWKPVPQDTAAGVPTDSNLSWSAGDNAVSHDVYFGTSLNAVVNATHASPEFKGNQTSRLYNLAGWMVVNTNYYWRVDEIDSTGSVCKGQVWSFTSAAGTCVPPLQGDLNTDCVVNLKDFALLASNWVRCTITNGICP